MPVASRRLTILGVQLVVALLAWSGTGATAQEPETARLRVLQGTPGAPAVDVLLDGAMILTDLTFGSISPALEVAAGEHHLLILPSDADPATDAALVEADLSLAPGSAVTLATANTLDTIEAQLIPEDPASVTDAATVRFVQLSADAPPVDVVIVEEGSTLPPLAAGIAYPAAGDLVALPAGTLALEIRPAGAQDGTAALLRADVTLESGTASSLFLVGSAVEGSLHLVQALDAALPPQPARLRVLHGSPGAPALDVLLDGTPVATELAFGSLSDPLAVSAGEHRIVLAAVAAGADADPLADLTLDLDPGGASTVALVGPAASPSVQVVIDEPAPVAGRARLRIVHLLSDVPAIDVVRDGTRRTLLKGLAPMTASEELAVRPGRVDLEVRQSRGGRRVVDLAPLTLSPGTSTSVFLVGMREDGTIDAVSVVDAVAP